MDYIDNFLKAVYPGLESLALDTKTEKEALIDAAELIANLTASRDRWMEYAMSLKRQQYQELIAEDMIAEECKAIAALKEAGKWEI